VLPVILQHLLLSEATPREEPPPFCCVPSPLKESPEQHGAPASVPHTASYKLLFPSSPTPPPKASLSPCRALLMLYATAYDSRRDAPGPQGFGHTASLSPQWKDRTGCAALCQGTILKFSYNQLLLARNFFTCQGDLLGCDLTSAENYSLYSKPKKHFGELNKTSTRPSSRGIL